MELIRESRPCLEYYDIEWRLDSNTTATTIAAEEQAVLCKLQSLRNEFAPEYPVNESMCRVSSASSISRQKGSLHVVVFKAGHAFHNNHTGMKAFMLAFEDYIKIKESTDSDKGNGILKCIGWLVYTRNRLMRYLGSAKCKEFDRPFVRAFWHAASVGSPAHEFFVTNVPSDLCLVSLDNIANIPRNLTPSLHHTINTVKKHGSLSTPFELEAPESFSASRVVDTALKIFQDSMAKKALEMSVKSLDEDKEDISVTPNLVLSLSASLSLIKDKDSSKDHHDDCVASMSLQFEAGFSPGSVKCTSAGMLVILKRAIPGWCILCNRRHDNSDAYLSISLIGKVSLGCYRNVDKQLIRIGVLPISVKIAMRDGFITPLSDTSFECKEPYQLRHLKYHITRSSLVFRSPPGTGMTNFMKKFIKKNPTVYLYVAVSCRRTLAEHLCKEFKLTNYMDTPTGKISGTRMAVQAESMWRLDLGYYRKHQDKVIFILDEFASLVEQFCSKTMRHKKGLVTAMFEQFLRFSHRVITLDANLTNAHTAILKEYRNDLYIVNNTYKAHAGDVFEFHFMHLKRTYKIV
ncbi:hypothetical protein BGZ76_005485 [Entomortierella beljakovae]|nr:hypothetical protein BGZ76_005485 [Entomortierella beljakovae]